VIKAQQARALAQVKAHNSELQREEASLREELGRLWGEVSDSEKAYAALEKELVGVGTLQDNDRGTWMQRESKLKKELETLKAELAGQHPTGTGAEGAGLTSLQEEIKGLRSEHVRLYGENASLQEQVAGQGEFTQRLKDEVAALKQEVATLQVRYHVRVACVMRSQLPWGACCGKAPTTKPPRLACAVTTTADADTAFDVHCCPAR